MTQYLMAQRHKLELKIHKEKEKGSITEIDRSNALASAM